MNDESQFMLIPEVAEATRVSASTVRHWIRSGKLASVRPGRRRLIERRDFERFLKQRAGR